MNPIDYGDPSTERRSYESEFGWKQRLTDERLKREDEMRMMNRESHEDKSLQMPGWGTSGGGLFDALHVPFQERRLMGRVFIRLGQVLLAAWFICWITGAKSPVIMGYSPQEWTLGGGLLCLALVYLAELAALALVLFAIWMLSEVGSTLEGFSLSAIPAAVWGKCLFIGIGGVALAKLFGRR
ncbi:MAG: hypothetical protein IPN76_04010 [Saprospiraceae bacterium]|nr:hypothetical protein [Saprospiraceae bacterium]